MLLEKMLHLERQTLAIVESEAGNSLNNIHF